MSIRMCPIVSGSSGNCIYVGNGSTNLLIDAGISGVKIAEGLNKINVSPSNIDAIFITHEHSDHIKGVGVFSRRFDKPIYATEGTWNGMYDAIGKINEKNIRYINKNSEISLGKISITPFEIPHDANSPVGYTFKSDNVKATIATDIGCITSEVKSALKDADIMLIEANHDVKMLKEGSYPAVLKRRILSDSGHLSNETTAKLIAEVISSRLKYIYLAHLSSENNLPQLAFNTVFNYLRDNGLLTDRCKMRTALRNEISVLTEV